MVRQLDKSTGEYITIRPGGLYSGLAIPAYRALANAEEYKAQQVLVCLLSYLGSNGRKVYPTYTQITQLSGVHRSSIRKALDVLVEFGFVTIYRGHTGKHIKNFYYINDSVYHVSDFNSVASKFKVRMFVCQRCANKLAGGEFKKGPTEDIHLGCGGTVVPLKNIQYATVI